MGWGKASKRAPRNAFLSMGERLGVAEVDAGAGRSGSRDARDDWKCAVREGDVEGAVVHRHRSTHEDGKWTGTGQTRPRTPTMDGDLLQYTK